MKNHLVFISLCLCLLTGCFETKESRNQKAQSMNKPTKMKTESGLEYMILQHAPEDAPCPKKGSTVTVHYTGWLADTHGNPQLDKKFDSSVDRGQPFKFTLAVGQVIEGWDEGVLAMKKGEKRRLTIPSQLAYGSRGIPGAIPPSSTLVFDVELIDIE